MHKVAYHAKYTLRVRVKVTVSQLLEREALYAQESNTLGYDELTKQ